MAHFLAIGRYHEMIKMIHGTILKEKIDHYGGALDFPGKIGAELPDEDVIVVLPDLLEVHFAVLHHFSHRVRLIVLHHLLPWLRLFPLG